jgi:DNA-binding FadR family transcriptional regulator
VKLAEQTAAKIELAIVEQGWPIGMVIGSESDLLTRYGVSRAVLREAVRLLERDHVAHMRRGPGGGLVVTEPEADAVTRVATLYLRYREVSIGQLYGVRIALEGAAVKAATERLDERGIALLREALDGEAGHAEQVDVTAHDFHVAVARLSGNPAVELFTDVVTTLTAVAHNGLPGAGGRVSALAGQVTSAHRGIGEAMIAGDTGLAQHRATRHLQAMAAASRW